MEKKKIQTEEELLKELNNSWESLKKEAEENVKQGKVILMSKAIPLINKTVEVLSKINKNLSKEVENGEGKTNRKK